MSTTRLVLIRHGESVAQERGFVAGHDGCRGLSDTGRRQASSLAERLAGGELGDVHALYASEMARAVETASIIAPAIGHAAPTTECGLCEIHPGDADGFTWAEIERRWPAGPDDLFGLDWAAAANAETWFDMRDRVVSAIGRIADAHTGETVVIACHGGVIAHAVNHHLGVPADAAVAWLVATNTSITELVLDETLGDWRKGRWGLVRFNDAAHLAGQAAG